MRRPIRCVVVATTAFVTALGMTGVAAPTTELSSRAMGVAYNGALATGQASLRVLLEKPSYRDLGEDPSDLRRRSPLDLRRSFRLVEARSERRVLRVSAQGEGVFKKLKGSDTFVMVRLDTRGDGHSDYKLKIFLGAAGNDLDPACYFAKSGRSLRYEGRPHFTDSGGVACVVKMRDVRVSHRVNWRLASAEWTRRGYQYLDHAPDSGWYS